MSILARVELDGTTHWVASWDATTWSLLSSRSAPRSLDEAIAAHREADRAWTNPRSKVTWSDEQLRAPVHRPGKIIGIAANYRAHAAEVGLPMKPDLRIFAKFDSSVTGPYALIRAHSAVTRQVDYEAELAVVIGSALPQGRAIDDPMEYVFGFTVANDISARDIQAATNQLTQAKSLDTFLPIGPWITVRSPGEAPITDRVVSSTVNGEIRQQARVRDMVRDVPTIIREVSLLTSLHPGDVILTGSPGGSGSGFDPPQFLKDGDIVTCEVTGFGMICNRVSMTH